MSIIIEQHKRVLVQGITGREGQALTRLMREFGTNVVAGVTPGKGGQGVQGVPVFDSVGEAMASAGPIDISTIFVPARSVKSAAIEAIEAGVKLLLLVPDRVPVWDAMGIAKCAQERGARFIGPNTLGVLSPGKAVLGMIGGKASSAREWFKPGDVGIISRSGGMTSSCGYYLGQQGIGLSTLVHVGGDQVLGMRIPDVALEFEADPETPDRLYNIATRVRVSIDGGRTFEHVEAIDCCAPSNTPPSMSVSRAWTVVKLGGSTQCLNGAPLRRAPGLRFRTGT